MYLLKATVIEIAKMLGKETVKKNCVKIVFNSFKINDKFQAFS